MNWGHILGSALATGIIYAWIEVRDHLKRSRRNQNELTESDEFTDTKDHQDTEKHLTGEIYICTTCGRVVRQPNSEERTCRGEHLHIWIKQSPS